MVKLYPISGWASGCLLATTHYGALESEVPESTSGLGLLSLSQHLAEDATVSPSEAGERTPGKPSTADVQSQPLGLGDRIATSNHLMLPFLQFKISLIPEDAGLCCQKTQTVPDCRDPVFHEHFFW